MEFVEQIKQMDILRQELDEVRSTRRGRLVSIRGRRRVGKSTLVQRFLEEEGIPHVFFAASRQPLARELELFLGDLAASELPAAELVRSGVTSDSWDAALTLVASSTRSANRSSSCSMNFRSSRSRTWPSRARCRSSGIGGCSGSRSC